MGNCMLQKSMTQQFHHWVQIKKTKKKKKQLRTHQPELHAHVNGNPSHNCQEIEVKYLCMCVYMAGSMNDENVNSVHRKYISFYT